MADPLRSFRLALSPPHPAGMPFVAAGAAVGVVGLFLHWAVALAGFAFALASAIFFRDPERVPPPGDGLVLAAADGKIVSVERVAPPAELAIGTEPRWRVATFLSIFDVHINRVPACGTVTAIAYTRGRFLDASHADAGEANERNAVAIRMPDGRDVGVVQIAGLLARRIVCGLRTGETVRTGARFGLIRFGSRTDVYLPPGAEPAVLPGQTSIGGETVLARESATSIDRMLPRARRGEPPGEVAAPEIAREAPHIDELR